MRCCSWKAIYIYNNTLFLIYRIDVSKDRPDVIVAEIHINGLRFSFVFFIDPDRIRIPGIDQLIGIPYPPDQPRH